MRATPRQQGISKLLRRIRIEPTSILHVRCFQTSACDPAPSDLRFARVVPKVLASDIPGAVARAGSLPRRPHDVCQGPSVRRSSRQAALPQSVIAPTTFRLTGLRTETLPSSFKALLASVNREGCRAGGQSTALDQRRLARSRPHDLPKFLATLEQHPRTLPCRHRHATRARAEATYASKVAGKAYAGWSA